VNRRALLGSGLSIGAGLLTSGCGRRRATADLSFWAMSYEGDYSPHLMVEFTRATGLTVDIQSLPWTAAHEKLLTAHAGGALPDVIMLPNGWVGEFAMIGAIAPVGDAGLLDDLFPAARGTTQYRGTDYAVPWSMAPQVQFFRRDLLAEVGYAAPPTDWDGWRAMGHALKRRHPDRYAMLLLLNWWDALFTFGAQTGNPPLRERDTRGNFATPEFREALAFYASLFREGLAPAVLSTEVQDPLAAFAQGQFAIYPINPTLLLDLKRRSAEIAPDKWGTARMPGPHGPGAASGVANSLAVTSTSRNPREAWALVRHLTSPASELRYQTLIGVLPARVSAWNDPQMRTAVLKPFAEQITDPAPTPNIVEWERIRLDVQTVAEKVVRGLMTIDEGMAEMNRRVDRLLAKRRALVESGVLA
jgi:multiple sugar transport system substrate-binding protein